MSQRETAATVTVMADVATLEREILVERTRDGLAAARQLTPEGKGSSRLPERCESAGDGCQAGRAQPAIANIPTPPSVTTSVVAADGGPPPRRLVLLGLAEGSLPGGFPRDELREETYDEKYHEKHHI
ncbi:hypothetical protein [Pseudarthrobacter sp. S9]|uniref:hypothetical protein n=1 Tax=Pseudarthrobacter sp. S9 TaxID=3418421 RepID=UPI003CFF1C23